MDALGGKVVREQREDFVDELIEKRVDARKAELARRKAERASAKAGKLESKLDVEIGDAQDKLQRTAEKARDRLGHTKAEMEAKLRALDEQAAKAPPEVKSRIERRIAEIRQQFGDRERKLTHAWQLAQEALHP